jgi:dTDP-4-dehydrorhamnose reductase
MTMRQRVLVTGASGQIGREIVLAAPPDHEVFAPSSRDLDISDGESVASAVARIKPDVVINAAAYTAVDKAESERVRAFATNADGAGNLARACSARAIPLLHLSTDYVFDGTNMSGYRESDRTSPLNVYGESKLAGERQIEASGAPGVVLRVAWVFGAAGTNFVKTMLRLAPRNEVRVVDDQRGTPCAAADIAHVLWRCAVQPDLRDAARVLHFASQPETTWFGFARLIFETAAQLGMLARIPHVEPITTDQYRTAARRPANSVLDSSRLREWVGMGAPDWRLSLREVLRTLADEARIESSRA